MKEKEMRGVISAMENEIRAREKKIISEAHKFAKEKMGQMREKAEKDNSELFAMEKKNIEREIRREEEKIREEHLLDIVQARESLVDEVFASAERKFLSMPKRSREYAAFMKKVLGSVRNAGDYDVYMRKEDRKYCKGAKPISIKGGAVFRSRDGKVEIDNSLEGIAARNREETRARINTVLFDE